MTLKNSIHEITKTDPNRWFLVYDNDSGELGFVVFGYVGVINEFEYIIIDRTPFNLKDRDKITLQIVPPDIYKASYPCWFFDKPFFINYFLAKNYSIVESFDGSDGGNIDYVFSGIIFKKND